METNAQRKWPLRLATHAYGYRVRYGTPGKTDSAKPFEVAFREPIELDEARRQLTAKHTASLAAGHKIIDVVIYTNSAHTAHVGL